LYQTIRPPQALDSSYFGELDSNGRWVPRAYTGSYGTNGFYFPFNDATHFGKDVSGNGNDWTDSGFTTDHQVLDTPTNNYCTWNLLDTSTEVVLADGALSASSNTANYSGATHQTILMNEGKWYAEILVPTGKSISLGIFSKDYYNRDVGPATADYVYYAPRNVSADLVINVAYDGDTGNVWYGSNGVWTSGDPELGTDPAGTLVNTNDVVIVPRDAWSADDCQVIADFGQRGFTYTPPTGFKALCTKNLPEPDIIKAGHYFNTITYTGNGSGQSITGLGFQPDFMWIKAQNSASNHVLVDSTRGLGTSNSYRALSSNTTATEGTAETNQVLSLDADGFTLGSNSDTTYGVNMNTVSYVAWCWKEGAVPGFDIVAYTGTGVAHAISHGLGTDPGLMLVKSRVGVRSWDVYHKDIGPTGALYLDSTSATNIASFHWNNTAPASSEFTVGVGSTVNTSAEEYIAYLFADVPGFCKTFSYTGNGSADGPFVNLDFQAAYGLIKRTDSSGSWYVVDTTRNTHNMIDSWLIPNSNAVEATGSTGIDVVSNGIKMRSTSADFNANGGSYIGIAFAEHPFKYGRAR